MFKILQYSEMECICARKITEGLVRESESPKTVSKALYHWPEALCFSLSILQVNPTPVVGGLFNLLKSPGCYTSGRGTFFVLSDITSLYKWPWYFFVLSDIPSPYKWPWYFFVLSDIPSLCKWPWYLFVLSDMPSLYKWP